jgi:hypothetical protein
MNCSKLLGEYCEFPGCCGAHILHSCEPEYLTDFIKQNRKDLKEYYEDEHNHDSLPDFSTQFFYTTISRQGGVREILDKLGFKVIYKWESGTTGNEIWLHSLDLLPEFIAG